jgi:hypothetical protein
VVHQNVWMACNKAFFLHAALVVVRERLVVVLESEVIVLQATNDNKCAQHVVVASLADAYRSETT